MTIKRFNNIKIASLLIFVLLYGTLLSSAVSPISWSGKVTEVLDGDIIKVLHEHREEKITLVDIDSPEFDQPFGSIAKKFTTYLSLGKKVIVQEVAIDSNGHIVAHIILPDGHNLNEDLVEAGLAWVSQPKLTEQKLSNKEVEARLNKLGIWSQQNPIPPWEWRNGVRYDKETTQIAPNQINDETSLLSNDEINASVSKNLKYESDEKSRFVIYSGFVVNFNCSQKGPNFTIHSITLEQISLTKGEKARRRSSFFVDGHNLKSCSATNNDYKKSGYDRGHMVPAGDYYWNQLLKNETFVLTNISPQSPRFNRGVWASLENAIRDRVYKTGHTFIIITGALYNDTKIDVIGSGKVGVPGSFYKIIYDPDNHEMFGFLISNKLDYYDQSLNSYQVRVDRIEQLANEDFFDRLSDELENSLESSITSFNNYPSSHALK